MAETPKHTPEKVWETIDGKTLKGSLREQLPQLFQGGRVSLEDFMNSGTAAGEALRRSLEAGKTTAVASTKKAPVNSK